MKVSMTNEELEREIAKDERRKKWIKEHPEAVRLTRTEQLHAIAAERSKYEAVRKLWRAAYIDKLHRIDGKTLREIAEDVGISHERVRQILIKILPKYAGNKKSN